MWHQRAGAVNLHFFPVPCSLFGHHDNMFDKDPLRTHIFIPMNSQYLVQCAKNYYYTKQNLAHAFHMNHQLDEMVSDSERSCFNPKIDHELILLLKDLFPSMHKQTLSTITLHKNNCCFIKLFYCLLVLIFQ